MTLSKFLVFLFIGWPLLVSASVSVSLDPNLVRPWNKDDKNQFPTPLGAVFKKETKTLIFVGDHHNDQEKTYNFLENAFNKMNPEIVVIEGLDFSKGESPKEYVDKYAAKSKEELFNEGGAAPNAARLAFSKKVPFIGGEPSLSQEMNSEFILSQGFTKEDIRNVQVVQRIPYRRDHLKLAEDAFFKYAKKHYSVDKKSKVFMGEFQKWYLKKVGHKFSYAKVPKEEADVNCSPTDTLIQKIACATNINRDRALVQNIESLLKKYDRVLVVYGTGHFVQEYPALIKAFGSEPQYIEPSKAVVNGIL